VTEAESQLVALWRQAAADLGFRFTSPFQVTSDAGRELKYLGLVHQFGRKKGALICLLQRGVDRIHDPVGEEYFISEIGGSSGGYKRQAFIDILNDWQWYGSEAERPEWYTGKPWGC
jgi:hypothetical protein